MLDESRVLASRLTAEPTRPSLYTRERRSRAIRYESRQRLHALRCRAHRLGCDRRFLPQRSGRRRSSWTGTGRVRRGQKLVALERGCPRGEDANALLCARPGSSRSHNSGGVRKQSEDEVRVVSAWARYVHARLRTVVERSVYRNRRSISGARMHAACCGRGSATGWEGCTPATASMTTTPGRGIAPYYAANEESGTK